METRELNSLIPPQKLLMVVLMEFGFMAGGIFVMLFVEPNGFMFGIGILVFGSIAGGVVFVLTLMNPKCPECHAPLKRESNQLYDCELCNVRWKVRTN